MNLYAVIFVACSALALVFGYMLSKVNEREFESMTGITIEEFRQAFKECENVIPKHSTCKVTSITVTEFRKEDM